MIWPSTRGTPFKIPDMIAQVRGVQKYIEANGRTQDTIFRCHLIDSQWYNYLAISIFTSKLQSEIMQLTHSEFFSTILHHLDPSSSHTTVERTYATAVEALITQFSWAWEGNPDLALQEIRKYTLQWQDLLRDSPPIQAPSLALVDLSYVESLSERLRRNTRTRHESNTTRYAMTQTFLTEFQEWNTANGHLRANNVGEYLRNIISCIENLKAMCLNRAQALGYDPRDKNYKRLSSESSNSTLQLQRSKNATSSNSSSREKGTSKDVGDNEAKSRSPSRARGDKSPARDNARAICNGCGKEHAGGHASCRAKDHPDFNKDKSLT